MKDALWEWWMNLRAVTWRWRHPIRYRRRRKRGYEAFTELGRYQSFGGGPGTHVPLLADPDLPPDTWELRDDTGKVLGRFVDPEQPQEEE